MDQINATIKNRYKKQDEEREYHGKKYEKK